MWISKAYAQSVEAGVELSSEVGSEVARNTPSAGEAFMWNMGLVALLVLMFYVLLIRPQQKRMRAHAEMLQGLKKGDKVVTAGGLIGKVSKIEDGNDEAEVDLGGGNKVTVLKSMLQQREAQSPANDAVPKTDKKAKN